MKTCSNYSGKRIVPVELRQNFILELVLQAASGADGLPAAEQPGGILVHGRLCATQLPGHAHRVLQHVRAPNHERPVPGLDVTGHPADALQGACAAQSARGIRSEVSQSQPFSFGGMSSSPSSWTPPPPPFSLAPDPPNPGLVMGSTRSLYVESAETCFLFLCL